MAGEAFTYWDYLKAAFWYKPRVGFFGPLPLNQLALFMCGLAAIALRNPAPLFLGGALEIGYLAFLSSHPSFQKLIQGLRLLKKQSGWEDRIRMSLASLSPESQARYRRLYQQCTLVLGISQTLDQGGDAALQDMRSGSLNQLLWLFLRLLTSRELIVGNISQVDHKALEDDLARLKERVAQAPPDSALSRSLQGTIEIQTKRLENLTKAKSTQEVIEAELDRIEQQVRLIREESAVSAGPEQMSSRLDAITATLGETSRWMDQNAEILGALGGEEADAPAIALPALPEPPQPATPPPPPPRSRQRS
jgi:hypothetical protein